MSSKLGAIHWSLVRAQGQESLKVAYQAAFFDKNNGVGVGVFEKGHPQYLTTSDGGKSWKATSKKTISYSLTRVNSNLIVSVGPLELSYLHYSSDTGKIDIGKLNLINSKTNKEPIRIGVTSATVINGKVILAGENNDNTLVLVSGYLKVLNHSRDYVHRPGF